MEEKYIFFFYSKAIAKPLSFNAMPYIMNASLSLFLVLLGLLFYFITIVPFISPPFLA